MAGLDKEESDALDDLNRFLRRLNEWGLASNRSEATAAVHVLQGFVIQRMLHRDHPEQFSNWYAEQPPDS